MKTRLNPTLAALATAFALTLPVAAHAQAQAAGEPKPAAKPAAAAPKAPSQRTYATPEEAAKALVDAVKAGDAKALLAVVGPQSKSWLFTGDDVADKADWERFAAAYEKKHAIERQG